MQKLLYGQKGRSINAGATHLCKCCGAGLCAKPTGPGIALICEQEGCENNWTRDGAEIILMLK